MECQLKEYYILYFDILGYKNKIKENEEKFLNEIQTCMREVDDYIKRDFECSFNKQLGMLPNEQIGGNISIPELDKMVFSDNFCFAIEKSNSGKVNEMTLKVLSYVAANFQMALIYKLNLSIRGAITVGNLYINYNENNAEQANYIFGSGLVNAVEKEAQAIYPRIIIDAALANDANLKCINDNDIYYLDYLSFASCSIPTYAKNAEDMINKHKEFIISNLEKHCDCCNVKRKFLWLKNYHNTFCNDKYAKYLIEE